MRLRGKRISKRRRKQTTEHEDLRATYSCFIMHMDMNTERCTIYFLHIPAELSFLPFYSTRSLIDPAYRGSSWNNTGSSNPMFYDI